MEMKASLYHGKQSFGATLGKKTATSPYLRKFSGWCAIRCSFQKDGSGNWRTSDGISQPRQEHEFASEFNRSHLYNAATKIKPLDLTGLSEDVSVNSIDAMKRTISGMLGILPSFEFTMSIDMKKESLVKLMQSALMTGYTLKKAEFRLALQQTLNSPSNCSLNGTSTASSETILETEEQRRSSSAGASSSSASHFFPEELGTMTPEVKAYICQLQERLDNCSKELASCKAKLSDLHFTAVTSDENNELLDYMRSLDNSAVLNLSKPSSELQVVLSDYIPKTLRKILQSTETESVLLNTTTRLVTASRDHLSSLLFWFMMLGHHLRSKEERLELKRMFKI